MNWNFFKRSRNILIMSVCFGCLIGIFEALAEKTSSQFDPDGWHCVVTQVNSCVAAGCRKSSNEPDSYWVCDYSSPSEQCPPLEQCESGGGDS